MNLTGAQPTPQKCSLCGGWFHGLHDCPGHHSTYLGVFPMLPLTEERVRQVVHEELRHCWATRAPSYCPLCHQITPYHYAGCVAGTHGAQGRAASWVDEAMRLAEDWVRAEIERARRREPPSDHEPAAVALRAHLRAAAASSPAPEQQGSGIDGVEAPTNGCTCGETAHEPVFHAQSCPYALGVKGTSNG